MLPATVWRNDSARNGKGRPGKSGPIETFNSNGSNKDNGHGWKAQLLVERHGLTVQFGSLVAAMLYGETADA